MSTTRRATHPLFERTRPEGADHDLAWLHSAREAALARSRDLGPPTPRLEAWRYAPTRALLPESAIDGPTPGGGVAAARAWLEARPDWARLPRLVFVDGHLAPELTSTAGLPEGVVTTGVKARLEEDPEAVRSRLGALALYENDALVGQNLAHFEDGAWIEVAAGTRIETPLLLLAIATTPGTALFTRDLLHLGEGSALPILEAHVGIGGGEHLHHAVTEVFLEAGSRLERVRLLGLDEGAAFTSVVRVREEADAVLRNHHLNLGGRASRDDLGITLAAEGAHAHFDALFDLRDRQQADHFTVVDHMAPRCTSEELYKGLLDEASEGGFTGRIIVREGADGTDAVQNNRNLLLSEGAQVATRPQLEIHADDVQCSHGATTGFLDVEQLFYLRSRGLPENEARRLLTLAFGREIVERIEGQELRDLAATWIASRETHA